MLVLGCTAFGKAFENLPIGQEVDELICDELLTKNKPARGVWIMGNGEPIMLVNDHGVAEYRIASKLAVEEELDEILKITGATLNRKQLRNISEIIKDKEESSMSKANLICEELGVEKRGNRQKINELLTIK